MLKLTPYEFHAFVIGFFEVLCPWKPRHHIPFDYPSPLRQEYHYYLAGRGCGFLALLCVIVLFSLLMKEVIS